jgi:hypothetical protein
VEKVSWYKREIVFAGIMALLLTVVLGAMSYFLLPQTGTQLKARSPTIFAFSLTGGNIAYESPTLENQTIRQDTMDWLQLEFEFIFANGSSIHEPDIFNGEVGKQFIIRPEYHGEFEAETLQRISIELFRVYITDLPENASTSLEVNKNTTISVSLRATQIIDLGVRTSLNERTKYEQTMFPKLHGSTKLLGGGVLSCSGFWETTGYGGWTINISQLSDMLQGNGTALITFDATINASISYEIGNENVETGEVTLSPWEGRIGTIEIVYEQGKITWIRYSFSRASLILLTTSQ